MKIKTGYPFRTIKLKDELAHGDNNGLDIPVRLLEPIKKQSHSISYDNFCQLASMIAAEVTGGCDVRFHPGGRLVMPAKKISVIYTLLVVVVVFFFLFVIRSFFVLILCKFYLVGFFTQRIHLGFNSVFKLFMLDKKLCFLL